MTLHVDDDARPTQQHNTHPAGVRGYRDAIIIFIQIASDIHLDLVCHPFSR